MTIRWHHCRSTRLFPLITIDDNYKYDDYLHMRHTKRPSEANPRTSLMFKQSIGFPWFIHVRINIQNEGLSTDGTIPVLYIRRQSVIIQNDTSRRGRKTRITNEIRFAFTKRREALAIIPAKRSQTCSKLLCCDTWTKMLNYSIWHVKCNEVTKSYVQRIFANVELILLWKHRKRLAFNATF